MPTNPFIRQQIAATNALVHFLKTHGLHVDEEFYACRKALEENDTSAALKNAYKIKVFGMGSVTDSYPTPIPPTENEEYCFVLLEALTRNWCFWISIEGADRFPSAKQPIDAIAKFLHNQNMRV